LAPDGSPAVAYSFSDGLAPGVHFALHQGETWTYSVVAAEEPAWNAWLAFDSADQAHVAFLGVDYGLHHAVRDKDAWVLAPAFAPYSAELGASFTLDAAAAAHAVTPRARFDDTLALRYATNRHLRPDAIDQNCDGTDGLDADHDGHASLWTSGDDCDDTDPNVSAPPGGTGEPWQRCGP
jgi:hypothetical protein